MEADERVDNLERQAEEAEALSAIYGDDFTRHSGGGLWEIRVPMSGDDAGEAHGRSYDDDVDPTGAILAATGSAPPKSLAVRVVLLETYPSRTAPLVELDARLLPFGRYELAMNRVEEEYGDNPQEVMVFGFVEWLRGMLRQWREEDLRDGGAAADGTGVDAGRGGGGGDDDDDAVDESDSAGACEHVWDPVALEEELAALALAQSEKDHHRGRQTGETGAGGGASASMEDELASRIVHGVPFTVMKSTFQAHLCSGLTSVQQVDVIMAILRQNGKVARATHNIMAYRIQLGDVWAQDHDEVGANPNPV